MLDKRVGNESDIILKKADEFVTRIFSDTKQFPKDEQFGLTSQLRRTEDKKLVS